MVPSNSKPSKQSGEYLIKIQSLPYCKVFSNELLREIAKNVIAILVNNSQPLNQSPRLEKVLSFVRFCSDFDYNTYESQSFIE